MENSPVASREKSSMICERKGVRSKSEADRNLQKLAKASSPLDGDATPTQANNQGRDVKGSYHLRPRKNGPAVLKLDGPTVGSIRKRGRPIGSKNKGRELVSVENAGKHANVSEDGSGFHAIPQESDEAVAEVKTDSMAECDSTNDFWGGLDLPDICEI